jgi:hypothetical protein
MVVWERIRKMFKNVRGGGDERGGEGETQARDRVIPKRAAGLVPALLHWLHSRDSLAFRYFTLLVSQRMTRMDANVWRLIARVG